jgi:HPt (histidine-containing phosphotransfer) domain-containing protein
MTAHAMQGDEQRCLDMGMDGYVAKPVKSELLEAMILRTCAGTILASAEQAVPQAPLVLDPDRLDEFCGADESFRREILQDFLSLAPQLLARIEAAVAAGDGPGVQAASHSLKGSARTLGAGALGAACEEVELLGAENALDAARAALARAQQEFERLQSMLQGYLPGLDTT